MITYPFDCIFSTFLFSVCNKAVAAVASGDGIHHQTKVPNGTILLEKWNQSILKEVLWNMSAVNLQQ